MKMELEGIYEGNNVPPLQRKIAIVVGAILLVCPGLFCQPSSGAGSSRISEGSNVTLLYQITVPGEGKFETPRFVQYVQGQHQLPPVLEQVVAGMKGGDKKQVVLSIDNGFGPYDEKKKKAVPRNDLPAGAKEGDILEDEAGRSATVTQLSDSSAVMDYNHPLAGKPLVVKFTILRVDDPS